MSGFDAVSHASGFGAGQTLERNKNRHEIDMADARTRGSREANQQLREQNEVLEGEINNRWIPYAVTLNASIVVGRVGRQALIDELKRLDPANVARIVEQADASIDAEYASLEGAKLAPISAEVRRESEERRLDR